MRVAVSGDGTFAAVSEPGRILVHELPGAGVIGEIGVDAAAEAFDAAWLGNRLLVVSRYEADTTVHLLDPEGPQSIAEIRLAAPVTLFATVGQHALVIGAQGAAVLTAGEAHLTPYQFPARVRPTIAGAAANQFVVAIPGTIEEWDPASRVPKRRLRLPRASTITALGGSERVVWLVAQQEPSRVDVLPLINRGQPKTHELPEAIARVAGHPRSDLLVCSGGERVYLIDLDGRARLRTLAFDGIDRVEAVALAIGRTPGVVAVQRGRPLAFAPIDAKDPIIAGAAEAARPRPSHDEPPLPEPLPFSRVTLESTVPPSRSVSIGDPPAAPVPGGRSAPPSRSDPSPAVPEPAPTGKTAKNLAARFAAIHERRDLPRTDSAPVAAAPARALDIEPSRHGSWRDALVDWARDPSGVPPAAPTIDELATRFELASDLVPALCLVYGAHLAGTDGVAPVAIARILDGRWDEALGAGELAAVMTYERSRVRLAPLVLRALDELPPATGVLVGQVDHVAVLAACVIVSTLPLPELARAHAARAGGAILVAHDDRPRADVCLEARALGAAAMLRAHHYDGDPAPAIYVADDEPTAPALPRL